MSSKPFRCSLIIGRFQMLHKGHEDMIGKAAAISDRVVVMIGSSQESGTEKNPFSYELRSRLLHEIFGDRIETYPLPDLGVGNNSLWGEYVMDQVRKQCGVTPDLLITGKESRRTTWFSGESGDTLAELCIPKTISISASIMRGYLLDDDRESWEQYSDPAIWHNYDELRRLTLSARGNSETRSI